MKIMNYFLCLALLAGICFAEETVKVGKDKTLLTDGVSIAVVDLKTNKKNIVFKGERDDLIKSLSADDALTKIGFLKAGKVYLLDLSTLKANKLELGTQDVGYYKNVAVSPDGTKIAGVGVNIAGGAPDELWVGKIANFKSGEEVEDDVYNGKRLITNESLVEAKWSTYSKTLTATTTDTELYVDSELVRVIKNPNAATKGAK